MKKQTLFFTSLFKILLIITSAGSISWYHNYDEIKYIENKSIIKLPVEDVFKRDYIKSTMMKVTGWQLNNPNHAPTDWTNGAFYAGVVAAYNTLKSKLIYDSLMALGERTRWFPGRRYDHADDIA